MTLEERIRTPGPKKILSLDGGGILGMISVEILAGTWFPILLVRVPPWNHPRVAASSGIARR